jgi:hypothetical protein
MTPKSGFSIASILLASRPNDVAAEAAKAVELGPDDPVIQVRAGHLLRGRGEIDTARACGRRARELAGPDFCADGWMRPWNGSRRKTISNECGVKLRMRDEIYA